MQWARKLASREGILTGVSGGSSFAIAMQIAEKADPGSVIVCMLPDTGERYLSTPLFAPFGADMNDEELEISRSTPGYQMT
jgi:cysteine synthase A